jgi:hypothetical protein
VPPPAAGSGAGVGLAVACRQGFAGVVVACEPTGHRWRVVVEHAHRLGLGTVCVQPLLVRRAREAEDGGFNRNWTLCGRSVRLQVNGTAG